MDLTDMKRKRLQESNTILVFNPLSEDFQGQFNREKKSEYLIRSKENKRLPKDAAKVIGSKIVDLYLSTKDKNYPREKVEKIVFDD